MPLAPQGAMVFDSISCEIHEPSVAAGRRAATAGGLGVSARAAAEAVAQEA